MKPAPTEVGSIGEGLVSGCMGMWSGSERPVNCFRFWRSWKIVSRSSRSYWDVVDGCGSWSWLQALLSSRGALLRRAEPYFSGMWARRSIIKRDGGASGCWARWRSMTSSTSVYRRTAISSLWLKPRVLSVCHCRAVADGHARIIGGEADDTGLGEYFEIYGLKYPGLAVFGGEVAKLDTEVAFEFGRPRGRSGYRVLGRRMALGRKKKELRKR